MTRSRKRPEPPPASPSYDEVEPVDGPTIPRQRRDAYTLYAEIYALRLEADGED